MRRIGPDSTWCASRTLYPLSAAEADLAGCLAQAAAARTLGWSICCPAVVGLLCPPASNAREWTEFGAALGISKQAAWGIFSGPGSRRRRPRSPDTITPTVPAPFGSPGTPRRGAASALLDGANDSKTIEGRRFRRLADIRLSAPRCQFGWQLPRHVSGRISRGRSARRSGRPTTARTRPSPRRAAAPNVGQDQR